VGLHVGSGSGGNGGGGHRCSSSFIECLHPMDDLVECTHVQHLEPLHLHTAHSDQHLERFPSKYSEYRYQCVIAFFFNVAKSVQVSVASSVSLVPIDANVGLSCVEICIFSMFRADLCAMLFLYVTSHTRRSATCTCT
jgi:hypothetical protein